MHSDADQTDKRRALVRTALVEGRFRTQAQLAAHLRSLGHRVSQASVSRDLREVGGQKIRGRYRLAPGAGGELPGLAGLVAGFVTAGPHLVVIHTLPGGAQRVAHAIDTGDWPEAAGTVAGDDTIFVATAAAADQRQILERLRTALAAASEAPA